jgi:hypothetical protein
VLMLPAILPIPEMHVSATNETSKEYSIMSWPSSPACNPWSFMYSFKSASFIFLSSMTVIPGSTGLWWLVMLRASAHFH